MAESGLNLKIISPSQIQVLIIITPTILTLKIDHFNNYEITNSAKSAVEKYALVSLKTQLDFSKMQEMSNISLHLTIPQARHLVHIIT